MFIIMKSFAPFSVHESGSSHLVSRSEKPVQESQDDTLNRGTSGSTSRVQTGDLRRHRRIYCFPFHQPRPHRSHMSVIRVCASACDLLCALEG